MVYIVGPGQGLQNAYLLYKRTFNWLDKTKRGEWTEMDQNWYDLQEGRNLFVDLYRKKYERERYMDRYGVDWSDIKQPWNLPGDSMAGAVGHAATKTLNFVSRNVEDLYKSGYHPRPMKNDYQTGYW